MDLKELRIAKSGITDEVFAGFPTKDQQIWRTKKDVTADFITAVLDRWAEFTQIITRSDGKRFEISVKEPKKPK